jgi:hypothetical protein
MINVLSHFQDVHTQSRSGIVEYEVWAAERQILAGFSGQPGFEKFWREAQQYFLPEFIKEMSEIEPINLVVYDPETHDWGRPGGVYLDTTKSKAGNGNANSPAT